MSATTDTTGTTAQKARHIPAQDDLVDAVERHSHPSHAWDSTDTAMSSWAFDHPGRLPEMRLPGFGSEREDCGEDLPHFCEDCGSTTTFGRTCYQSDCPRCASAWCRRRSVEVVWRLMSLLKLKLSKTMGNQWFHHVVVSPPKGWIADVDAEDYDSAKEAGFHVVRDLMRELGIEGVAVYHPYRGEHEGPGEDDQGEWKERLFSERDWKGDVKDELVFSPHFHVIGVAPFVAGQGLTKGLYDETGWIVHRIADEDSGRSIDGDRAMVRATTYCLSHAGLYQDSNGDTQAAYRYYGSDLNSGLTSSEETKQWAKVTTREEAWKVLGIPTPTLVCGATVHRDCDDEHDHEHEHDEPDVEDDDRDEDPDGPDAPDADGGERSMADSGRCTGELINLKGAPYRLYGEEYADWREQAEHIDELRTKWEDWRDREDWLRENVPDEALR